MSEEKSFTAPKSASDKSFKVIFYSDPQSESVENYMSFKDSIDQALKICPNPDLMISAATPPRMAISPPKGMQL